MEGLWDLPCDLIPHLSSQDEDGDGDGHRTCYQQRTTPSPDPYEHGTTPPPALLVTETSSSPSAVPNADFLCLFPESAKVPQDNYKQEVGVASSYEEGLHDSLLEHQVVNFDPTIQSENEFAELDPYLAHDSTQSSVTFNPPATDDRHGDEEATPIMSSEVEVGVDVTNDVTDRTIPPEASPQEEGQGEESASPVESVLYSHSHY